VFAILGGPPPKAKAAVFVPAPASLCLAVFKSFNSVQLVPFQDSVFPTLTVVSPPNAKAAVLVAPQPAKNVLAVFKSLTSVHEVPFQFSVAPVTGGDPPKAKAAV
jgi:hypothetical protein